MKEHFLFDLDGTLVDSGEGVINAVIYALGKFGISVDDRTKLFGFMGPPLWASFEKYYGFDKAAQDEAVRLYREYYSVKGLMEFSVYDGMEKLLCDLSSAGKKLWVATSKPTYYAGKVLGSCGLDKYFGGIFGSEFDGTRSTKVEVLRYALEKAAITDKSSAVMIGDREYDIDGGHAVGIESAGVLFGYGSEEEFRAHNADYIFASPSDVLSLCRQTI